MKTLLDIIFTEDRGTEPLSSHETQTQQWQQDEQEVEGDGGVQPDEWVYI